MTRRVFASALAAAPFLASAQQQQKKWFQISLAEWSVHKAIFGNTLKTLDFPQLARDKFGIEGLEFVNTLWGVPTQGYIQRLKKNMNTTGTKGVMIMCDDEGMMGHSEKSARMKAARNHYKWIDYAAELGCKGIRTNMYPDNNPKTEAEISEYLKCCAESFNDLCGYAAKAGLNVMIENHGGLSSDPDILVRLMKLAPAANFGLLPDFGNFYGATDRYDAVKKMMPYAKGVSFKCWDFGPDGKETKMDMARLMKIVQDSGFKGWVGIEYEGERLPEYDGIAAAKKWLDTVA
jgi:sugar phosphate isomerase/epimerase